MLEGSDRDARGFRAITGLKMLQRKIAIKIKLFSNQILISTDRFEKEHVSAILSAGEKRKQTRIMILCWGHAFRVTPDNIETLEIKKVPNAADQKYSRGAHSSALKHRVPELGIPANPSLRGAPAVPCCSLAGSLLLCMVQPLGCPDCAHH